MVNYTFDLYNIEYFLLILVRISCFVFTAPFFSMRGVPNITKIGLSAILSMLMMGTMTPNEADYTSVIGYAVLVFREAITGLLLGFSASIANYIVMFAGNVMDMDIGFAMVTEFDISSNSQVTITANMYYYFTLLLLLVGGMHRFLIRALADSFSLIPLGGAVFRRDVLLQSMIVYMRNLFVLGFRIMLPVFAVMLTMNVILGIMAKVAPQMNMFSVGVQIKILVAFAVMYLMVFLFPEVVDMITEQMKLNLRNVAGGLHY
ncbi:MAG TPA: flagellar biosynthetic protein FliR [Lachnospiraceae bacterium]|jgi:flagellar biosynthetic protein FliR|nr:flagellar biosynthetic protein FliR [Lachnospiraceae bacterium]MDD7664758.1 flagellar biosynthetic protein FliR [Lachnospiraceae bacterium]MDY4164936.1 flagellar biosynthetic protein FliR [Lachnospiraceae bacterium]HAP03067.1 flagellar biosynthetic protein FliR [Lachnospiraceae bacterium]